MRLFLVRHGQTETNTKHILSGQTESKLSKKGKAQTKRVAQRLKDEKIDAIFSSDLERCIIAAKEIAKFHKKAKLNVSKELRERYFGDFEGKKVEEMEEGEKEFGIPHLFNPKNAEPSSKMRKRAKAFLKKLLKKFKNKTVLAVTHGGMIRYLVAEALRQNNETIHFLRFNNSSISLMEFEGKKTKARLMNCTKHLHF